MTALTFVPRERPLEPRVVVAHGACAKRLARAVLATPERLRQLRVAVADDLLIAEGPAEQLPWVDGVEYLGADASTPALFVPTTQATSMHAALAEAALRRALRLPRGRLAVLRDGRVIQLDHALTAAPDRLRSWAET